MSFKLISSITMIAGKGHPAERPWEMSQRLRMSVGGMDEEGQISPVTRGKS